jgi:predicted nucleic acid-binding protein
MSAAGTPVNTMDYLVAGTAIAHGAERITTCDLDFEKIAKYILIRRVFRDQCEDISCKSP